MATPQNNITAKPHLSLSNQTYLDVIITLFALLFLYAGTNILLEYGNFQIQISKSPILTDYAHFLVWAVPNEVRFFNFFCIEIYNVK